MTGKFAGLFGLLALQVHAVSIAARGTPASSHLARMHQTGRRVYFGISGFDRAFAPSIQQDHGTVSPQRLTKQTEPVAES